MADNYNLEENKSTKKNNKNMKTNILIVCLIFIILGLVFYILYDKEIIFHKENSIEEKEESLKETNELTQDVEKEITSKDIKISLSKKIDQITFRKDTSGNDYFVENSYAFNFNLLKNSTLTEEEKLIISLKTLSDKYTSVMIEPSKMDLPSEWESWRNEDKSGDYQIQSSYVKERYNSLFGLEEIQYQNIESSICPKFIYDKTNEVYYILPRCGGTSGSAIISYKANYMKKGNEAYIYVYYGTLAGDGQSNNLYNSIIENYDELPQIPYQSNINPNEQLITSQNYTDFKKYKFTFKLNDNQEYNFVKVEQE